MQRMNPGRSFASAGGDAAATSSEQSPDIVLQPRNLLGNAFAQCDSNSDGNKDGPLRPDTLFDALFAKEVFPHLCRAFEECDIDVPTSQAQEADSVSKIAVTDDGFKKMIECYKVKNREILNQGRDNSRQSSKKDKLETDKKFWEYRKDVADTVKSVALSGTEANHDESSLGCSSAFASGFWKSSFGQYLSEASANDHYGNKSCWEVVTSSVAYPMSSPDPFFSFCFWLLNHSLIPHKNADTKPQHKCRGEEIVDSFSKEPENQKNLAGMVALIRFCHMLRFWHRSCFASKTQCIFELCYCSAACSMFNLCFDKGASRSLRECMKLIELDYLQIEARKPSSSTSRWILLHAGRSLKQWGHRSLNEFEQCEVEKESNRCEKWRHLIFSYAVMALLYSEFNGNKQGPLGKYYFRDQCKIGEVGGCQGESEKYVYASKKVKDGTGECSDYLGHNIVALAVCKRGSILRVSYNHNVLFSSTVDHAEERLIDGLFKDPSAFIARSHAKIFRDGQRVNIEDHMKHISVYTSLEPCQQCSGKLHIAEVPELVFCQRDWVSV
jgi:tRNA(Arg) A34 adenosine deaminase TadA